MLFLLFFPGVISAAVPFGELEKMRQLSVVARVAIDFPDSKALKSCKVKDITKIGSNLELAMANAEAGWAEVQVAESDLGVLKKRIKQCEKRGSCQVYSAFLTSAKAKAASELMVRLEQKLAKVESESYQRALATVANPCKVLKELR